MAADTTWHLPAAGWVLGGEAQGAPEDRTRGMRSWTEGGTARGCGGVCGWPACSASMPRRGSPRSLRTVVTPVPCADVLFGIMNHTCMSTLQEELLR